VNPAISIRNLGKEYKVYDRPRDRLMEWVRGGQRHRSLWAIRNADVEIGCGEAVGIVGQNGAGKSTLLKMLAGTVLPTEGGFAVHGRVAALLELGIAFHPYFTGRQNATMACQLGGLPDAEIRRLLPEIQQFSELGDHFEQPVRTYSSGMHLRLAFATATASRPEVLIVDEALSVGDAYFQYKCFQRIQSFRADGTTLLFVSHDPNAVLTLCDRAVLIEGGRLVMDDEARLVLEYYQGLTLRNIEHQESANAPSLELERVADAPNPSPDGKARSERYVLDAGAVEKVEVELLDAESQRVGQIVGGSLLQVRIRVRFARDVPDPHIGFGIKNQRGLTLFETNTYCSGVATRPVVRGGQLTATFSMPCPLQAGDYFVNVGVANGGRSSGFFESSLFLDQASQIFTVIHGERSRSWGGVVDLDPRIEVAHD